MNPFVVIVLASVAIAVFVLFQVDKAYKEEEMACLAKGGEWVSGRVQTCFAKGTVIDVRKSHTGNH